MRDFIFKHNGFSILKMSQLQPRGLMNIGNTCYINTLFQCLASCESFRYFVAVEQTNDPIIGFLGELFRNIHGEGCINPTPLLQAIQQRFNDMINVREQNDINEIYALLIDHIVTKVGRVLTDAENAHIRDIIHTHTSKEFDILRKRANMHWYQHHRKEYSKCIQIVHGQYIYQTECSACHQMNHNYEVYSNNMLSLPEEEGCMVHLMHLIEKNYRDETITEWICDKCNAGKDTFKTRAIRNWKNPQMLVYTIKRFTSSGRKIRTPVEAPFVLDISQPSVTIGPTHKQYRLCGIACHHASYMSGHYIAIICRYDAQSGKPTWYEVDDESVSIIVDDDIVRRYVREGYMYFYDTLAL